MLNEVTKLKERRRLLARRECNRCHPVSQARIPWSQCSRLGDSGGTRARQRVGHGSSVKVRQNSALVNGSACRLSSILKACMSGGGAEARGPSPLASSSRRQALEGKAQAGDATEEDALTSLNRLGPQVDRGSSAPSTCPRASNRACIPSCPQVWLHIESHLPPDSSPPTLPLIAEAYFHVFSRYYSYSTPSTPSPPSLHNSTGTRRSYLIQTSRQADWRVDVFRLDSTSHSVARERESREREREMPKAAGSCWLVQSPQTIHLSHFTSQKSCKCPRLLLTHLKYANSEKAFWSHAFDTAVGCPLEALDLCYTWPEAVPTAASSQPLPGQEAQIPCCRPTRSLIACTRGRRHKGLHLRR
ncbi:unnamed protein product [Protopolystoma xenopodis]|uniref:Uncharacterized protein n=1 Tax=Protopolystoma xenopodis TaxID=117903 RepID=A0A3S5CIT4_9PLAT|nr:unnamed protein product [Protopolystoma xenopodis]